MQDEFNALIETMDMWRNEDHEDCLTLSRNDVIVLLEGYKKYVRYF